MRAIVAIRHARPVCAALWLAAGPAMAEVEVTGIEGPVLENVMAHLTLDERPCAAAEQLVRREFRDVDSQVTAALRAYGYYSASIDSSLAFDESCWRAEIAIDPGEPVILRNVDFELVGEAADDAAFENAVARFGLASGGMLNHGAYESAKRRLLELARDRGYPEGRWTASRVDVYPAERVADITLHFDSGPRYRFGTIDLVQDALRPEFIWSFLDFEEGDLYNNARLTQAYVDLSNSGYFDAVDVRAGEPERVTRTIPVEISLTAAPRRLISYGVGFSTDTGPRVRFGRTIRRWNDRGHQLGVNAQLSPVASEFTANYRMPIGDPRLEWLSFDGGIAREDTETAQSDSLEFGARRVIERPGGWTRTQMLSLHVEDFQVADQAGRSRLLMPGVSFTRLRGDDTLRPSKGSRLAFEVRGGSDAFGSDTSFAQTIVDTKWITSFEREARLLLRAKLGATIRDNFADLPPSVRFFAGGDSSIRGYDFESLGPVDADGKVIGGSHLAVASVEYEIPIKPRWSFAMFVDSGNAFERGSFDVKTGAGLGARWQSPLGPVRIDVGVPVNDPEHGARLHISLGPDL